MAREVAEQPAAVAATVDALRAMRSEIRRVVDERQTVFFVARGSSDNAAVYGRYLVEVHAERRACMTAPSVATHYRSHLDLSDAVTVAVSQSGETEEIIESLEWAARCGARTIAITNTTASTLARAADLTLPLRAGPERAVPATKSYTSQLAAMAILATALGRRPDALDADLDRVPAEMDRLLRERAGVAEAVDVLADSTETLVSGRGLVFGTALEVALKLEETSLRPVRGLSYADLRHGPIAIVDADLVAILVSAANGPMLAGMTELAAELRERRAKATIGIGGDSAFRRICDVSVPGPELREEVAPLALIVPAQLIVEALSRRLGLDPDAPRGLTKVTQTDPTAESGDGGTE